METSENKIIPAIFGLNGYNLTKKEINLIKNNKIYGYILFSRNILNLTQLKNLISHINFLSTTKPIIMIDHEGGRVNRFSKLFSQKKYTGSYFGSLYIKNRKKFVYEANLFIDFNTKLFKYLGINTVAYPVSDLSYKRTTKVIGDRSFSNDPKVVNKLSKFFIKKYHCKGINCISKHFPGHGLATVDSHYALPVVNKNLNYLERKDLLCFQNIDSKFIMTAHIKFKLIDNIIATYSKKIISIVRNKLKFRGLIMTDDICMHALKEDIKYRVLQPLLAGCNIILHCNGKINEMTQIVSIIKKWMNQKT